MLLVTTAIEETWGNGEPVLFLGEWCRIYSRKDKWEKLAFETLPYHWDDRQKLKTDFHSLQELNENLLLELRIALNELHKEDRSVRYWRILLGYWLNLVTAVLFDRWEMIHVSMDSGKANKSIILRVPYNELAANDSASFQQHIQSDWWNHAIYAKILTLFPNTQVDYRDCPSSCRGLVEHRSRLSNSFAKELIKKILNWFSSLTSRANEPFIVGSYLPVLTQIRIELSLGMLPKFWIIPKPDSFEFNDEMRRWDLPLNGKAFGFEAFVRDLLPKLIPRVFIEGFQTAKYAISRLSWPKEPKLIFTANSHFSHDIFKMWAGEAVEIKRPLITADHGGFGSNAFNGAIKYQLDISDLSLSWGWQDEKHPHVKPFGILTTIGKRQKWNSKGCGLMVEVAMPRYSYDIRSMAVASQMLHYFEEQYHFYAALPEFIRRHILIRTFLNDYGWHQKARWKDRFPDANLDDGKCPIDRLLEKSRLYISTYNATTYVESLSINIPTIMFWDPNHWELRSAAIPYFDRLKEVGIFHETPQSAAAKVEEIWNDVPDWWASPVIQNIRKDFCNRFAKTVSHPGKVLKQTLLSHIE